MCNLRTFLKFLHFHVSSCKINRLEAREELAKVKENNSKGKAAKDEEKREVKTRTSKPLTEKKTLNTNAKYGPLPQLMNQFDDVMR